MSRSLSLLVLLAVLGGGCRCGGDAVEPLELGFLVAPQQLDFGRVLEGDEAMLTLTLTAKSRAGVSVQLTTEAPFRVGEHIDIPGAGAVQVPVVFHAGASEVVGVLRLTVGEQFAEVGLRGVGVRPLNCTPSAECIVSTYSLADDRCVESAAANDSPCDPQSRCLEQGRCRSGQCLGVTRSCDDNNACTDDACSMDLGCVHTTRVCPAPSALCQQATCDPDRGCGQGPAPDLTACGSQDCVEVHFCYSGDCRVLPAPEGLPCAPAFACLPEATCHQQKCQRVKEDNWSPSWSAPIDGEVTGPLTSVGANLFFSTCGDGGALDADGGWEEGSCALTSLTSSGFERFRRPYADEGPRVVLSADDGGVLLQRDGGLELRTLASGGLLASLEVEVQRELLVNRQGRVLFWGDGGVYAWSDGGVSALAALSHVPSALGLGRALYAWSPDAGVLTRMEWFDDGGVLREEVALAGFDAPSLAVARDTAVVGAQAWVQWDAGFDAGSRWVDWSGAGVTHVLHELTLATPSALNFFFQRCLDDGGCTDSQIETAVQVMNPATGDALWSSTVTGPSFPGTMRALSLVDGRPGAFMALVRDETDTGPRAKWVLYAEGERQAVCHLPPVSGAVEQTHFSSAGLVVAVRRPDGRVVIESYPWGALSVSFTGWSTPQGYRGSRADGP